MTKVKLYHFTDRDIDKIEVKNFGSNSFTQRDIAISKVKRAFFYLEPIAFEYRFKNCQYVYETEIDQRGLYDLRIDTENLRFKYRDIDRLLADIKSRYKGTIYNVGSYDIAILFVDIIPVKKIKIKEGISNG